MRIQLVCETDLIRTGGALVTADSFDFNTASGYFGGNFGQAIGTSSAITEGGSEPRPLPTDRWLTVALQYDPAGAHVELNGAVVNRWEGWNGLLAGTAGLIIGNDRTGDHGVVGTIDDIKIWRLNPHLIGDTFVDRPVDTKVGRCWAEWSRKLDEILKADPVCAKRVFDLLERAMYAVMNNLKATPNIEPGFSQLALRYQELWSQGRLGEIQGVLNDMIVLLREAGLNPAGIADLQALQTDSCFASLVERLPINCDVAFADMFNVSEGF